MDAISHMEFDYIASGHYANVVHSYTDQMDKPSVLELSKDMVPMCETFSDFPSYFFFLSLLFLCEILTYQSWSHIDSSMTGSVSFLIK